MITLNLVSPAKKQELKLRQIYLMIKNAIVLILLFTIIVAIILLLAKMFLQNYFNKIVASYTLTTKISRLFNEDIREFNQQIDSISEIQKDFVPWSKLIIHLSDLISKEVGVSSFNLNKAENKIKIQGIAQTRDKLLDFKNRLESSPVFQKLDIPLKSLLKKEKIDFELEIGINIKEIQNL